MGFEKKAVARFYKFSTFTREFRQWAGCRYDVSMRGPVHVIRHPAPAAVDPAVHERILTAIHEKRLLRFFYHGKIRIVEPQDYGIQKGAVHLFTYQFAGESSSGTLPDWRKFAVRSMSKVELLDKTFPGSRSIPSQKHQEWDVLFARVERSSTA